MRRFRLAGLAIAAAALAAGVASAQAPASMRIVRQYGSGSVDALKIEQAPVPEAAANRIRVRVYAASINPYESALQARPPGRAAAGPTSPGGDVAGVVDAVGPGVTTFKVGDKVFGAARAGGGWADYALLNPAVTVLKPAALTYEEAAGIPTVGYAAVRFFDLAGVKPGERVVVIGAAGGVGSSVVQLVQERGAQVIAVALASQAGYLRRMGVTQIVASDTENPADKIKNADVVINTVTSQADAGIAYLRPGGRLTSSSGRADPAKCEAAKVQCLVEERPPGSGDDGLESFQRLARMAGAGKYRVYVESRYPLEQVAAAQQQLAAGKAQGKIVLAIDPARSQTR